MGKFRISPIFEQNQSVYKGGFTANTSPLHAALIVEEIIRNSYDNGNAVDLILLDAKDAFDLVDHHHILRRVYHSDVKDKLWSIIHSILSGAKNIW